MPAEDYKNLTIGRVWQSNIQLKEGKIRDILNIVRGEHIIEKMIA